MADFGAAEFEALAQASPAQMDDMAAFKDLLVLGNQRMNLVGPSALENFWLRHAWDCAQLLPLAPEARVWADIGAGAGFPGLVLAILLKPTAGARLHLIESIAKKCRFLNEVVEQLKLPVTVHNARAEDLRLADVEVVTARACAPVDRLFGFAAPLMRGGAMGLFLKGRDVESEIADARRGWRFTADLIPSRSDALGGVLKVEAISRG